MMPGELETMAERQERLERAIGSYLEAVDAGLAPDPGQWVDRHPDLQPELAAFLADRAHLDRLVGPLRLAVSGAERDAATRPSVGAADPPAETQGPPPAPTQPAGAAAELPPGQEPPEPPSPGDDDDDGADLPRGAKVRYFGDY